MNMIILGYSGSEEEPQNQPLKQEQMKIQDLQDEKLKLKKEIQRLQGKIGAATRTINKLRKEK